jgi:predicted outer membrane repeat protein
MPLDGQEREKHTSPDRNPEREKLRNQRYRCQCRASGLRTPSEDELMVTRVAGVLLAITAYGAVCLDSAQGVTRDVPAQYATIQAAIDASSTGDVIVVAPGVYRGAGNRNIDFKGKSITVRGTQPDDYETVFATVIDCQMSGRGFLFQTGETTAAILEGLTVANGQADQGAGVCCNGTASPTIRNCVFTGNLVPSGSATGNAVFLYSPANAAIQECVFIGNGISGGGQGGVVLFRGSATIANCSFISNTGTSAAAILVQPYATSAQITNCAFDGNTTSSGGGAISINTAATTISNCRFIGNSGSYGGAIYIYRASPSITNCAFTGNKASVYGAGIYVSDGITAKPAITHCTFSRNTATSAGGAVRCESATPTFTNCILWGDLPQECSFTGTGPILTYCDVQGGWTGAGNINLDPLLAMANDAHLLSGSPCIDAATTAGMPSTDLEGVARPQDGNGDGSLLADLGAYEYSPDRPRIAVEPTQLEYLRPFDGGNPPDQSLALRNSGSGTLAWHAVSSASWLQVLPAEGTSAGELVQLTVRVNADNLSPGDHGAAVTIVDEQSVNGSATVYVRLYVGQTLHVPGEYASLRPAITNARNGDRILIADGIYTGIDNRNLDLLGKAISIQSENGPDNCILDCQGQYGAKGFVLASKEGPSTIVEGLTIKDPYYYDSDNRGVIQCSGTSPTIRNCRIVWTVAPDPHYSFRNPAIYSEYGGSPTITGCTITGYRPAAGASYGGTGIVCNGGAPKIQNCEITNIVTWGGAGAVYVYGSAQAEITDCVFRDNIGTDGGGISCKGATATVRHCRIEDNAATNGGGVYGLGATVNLVNCRIVRNSATEYGGGLGFGYTSTISRSLVSASGTVICNNRAKFGAGAHAYQNSPGGVLSFTNCTIAQNEAVLGPGISAGSIEGSAGGGITCLYGALRLANSIIYGNKANTGPSIVLCGSEYQPISTANVAYCNLEGGRDTVLIQNQPARVALTWGSGNIDRAPGFALPDDYHLLSDSANVDAGTNTPLDGLPVSDPDGNPRAIDAHGSGNVADIGAYEYNPGAASVAVSPALIQFQTNQENAEPAEATLSIRNSGGGGLSWSISETCDWLEVTPTEGYLTGQVGEAKLRVHAGALAPGFYNSTLTINNPLAIHTPVTVRVTVRHGAVLHVPGQYATIQNAINAAVHESDVVVVGDGTWTGTGMKNLTVDARGITVKSANGPDHCVIDCQGSGSGFICGYSLGVPSTLEGFTVTRASDSGVKINSGNPVIRNCRIINNTATTGGGVYVGYYSPTLVNCVIDGNTATTDGGGVYWGSYTAAPMVTDCVISNNRAGRNGGGAYSESTSVQYVNCSIAGNAAVGNGGGVRCSSFAKLTGCSVTGNTAVSGGGAYGGVITQSRLSGNAASDAGGGAYCPIISNCVIDNNRANNGGGLALTFSDSDLKNCTIVGNTATGMGGGLHYWGNGVYIYSPKMTNCIVRDNVAPTGGELSAINNDGALTVRYCDVLGGMLRIYVSNTRVTWGLGNIDADASFINPGQGDFHLSPVSPCIDAGNPASDYSLEPEPDGGCINMGAYGNTAEAETRGWLYIQGYGQIRKTRIGRTLFEYELNVKMINAGQDDASNVVAEVIAFPANVQVQDGTVMVGSLPAGMEATSSDTFTIRVDRSAELSQVPISWRVSQASGTNVFTTLLHLNETPPADLDSSGHVDDEDMQILMACGTGPGVHYDPNHLPSKCVQTADSEGFIPADLDRDRDVDMDDFGGLQACYGGPNAPPACE